MKVKLHWKLFRGWGEWLNLSASLWKERQLLHSQNLSGMWKKEQLYQCTYFRGNLIWAKGCRKSPWRRWNKSGDPDQLSRDDSEDQWLLQSKNQIFAKRDVRHFSDSISWRHVTISGNTAYIHFSLISFLALTRLFYSWNQVFNSFFLVLKGRC